MISNFSMPENNFRATDSSGTWVMVKRKVRTVRPREMEIGMPVSIKAKRTLKITRELMAYPPFRLFSVRLEVSMLRERWAKWWCFW